MRLPRMKHVQITNGRDIAVLITRMAYCGNEK